MNVFTGFFNPILNRIGLAIAKYLNQPVKQYTNFSLEDSITLKAHLKPGDILLVEGNQRISTAIKYLTQSTWSHSAIYIGDIEDPNTGIVAYHQLIEADLVLGVISVSVDKYSELNTRICQPVGLTDTDRRSVLAYMVNSIGKKYDQKHIFDLARYLFPTPPVPSKYRRKMLVLGSGDPTRAICSTLIAEAYQSIRYPILPTLSHRNNMNKLSFALRHHSLFVPKDFDISPFFNIIKPEISQQFDHTKIEWHEK